MPSPSPSLPSTMNSSIDQTIAGTYSDPGLGMFTLCHASSYSDYCALVKKEFGSMMKEEMWQGALYGTWAQEKVWGSHLLITQKDNSSCGYLLNCLYISNTKEIQIRLLQWL